MSGRTVIHLAAWSVVWIACGTSIHAQSPSATQTTSMEQQPLRRDHPQRKQSSAVAGAQREFIGTWEAGRVITAVTIVIGLIVILWLLARWMFPAMSASRRNGTVQVLARCVIAPKQQILLLKVARRIIVVGDNGSSMSALDVITDADDVACLVGQIEAEKRPSSAAFAGYFARARESFEQQETTSQSGAPENLGYSHIREELGALLERVKGLSKQFRKP